MAEAKKCDRCGGFYTEADKQFIFNKRRLMCIRAYDGSGNIMGTHDLCDECADKLYKFLCNEEETESEQVVIMIEGESRTLKEHDQKIASDIYDAVTRKLISLGTDLETDQAIQNVILDFVYKED